MERRVIRFHYTVTDPAGKTLDSSRDKAPLTILEGAGQLIPGVENALKDLAAGEKRNVRIAAADAYGERDEDLVRTVARDRLPTDQVAVGDRFSAGDEGSRSVFVVTAVTDTHVTLDGNHPLAGLELAFDLELVDSWPATADEIGHGHAHGPGGHH